VYGWFSDGFDALDLKEAKALLEELAAMRAIKDAKAALGNVKLVNRGASDGQDKQK
jgi:hypothetical protein